MNIANMGTTIKFTMNTDPRSQGGTVVAAITLVNPLGYKSKSATVTITP